MITISARTFLILTVGTLGLGFAVLFPLIAFGCVEVDV
jgi:hypothetical protein